MIKTFRGKLADGGQNKIRLSTMKGKIGYKIVKFQVIGNQPGVYDEETIVKIFKVVQTTIDAQIDFSDGNLLGACFWQTGTAPTKTAATTIVFDQETFNQDIYITSKLGAGGAAQPINYYIELEMMPLSDNAAAVSTLRDIRLNPQKHA
jgi:hypothetical protein